MEKAKAIFTLLLGGIAVLLLILIIFSVIPLLINVSGGTFETKGSVVKFTLVVAVIEFFIESLIAALYRVFTEQKASKNSIGFFVVKTVSLYFIVIIVSYFMKGVEITSATAILFALLYASLVHVVEVIFNNTSRGEL